MKTTTKKAPVNKLKKGTKKASNKRVPLAHQNRLVLRRLRLVEPKHTGKIIHHKNTSHVSLVMILLVFGLFLFATGQYARAIIQTGSVTVGLTVLGSAPKSGATITIPTTNEKFIDNKIIAISGVCEKKTFVVVKSNNSIIGSTNCTEAGTFSLSAQLQYGDNVLSALDYDNLNQAGPITPSVLVSLSDATGKVESGITPVLPDNPSTVPTVDNSTSSCDNYNVGQLPVGNEPHVAVICVPRLSLPKINQVMGILVWGGTPPYAVSVDWNNGNDPTLISVASTGYKTVSFSYAVPKTYKINLKLKDYADKEAVVETAVQVYSSTDTDNNSGGSVVDSNNSNVVGNMTGAVAEAISSGWFETPVPFYLLAVAITLGFWFGDIFDRRYNSNPRSRKRRLA